MSAARTVLAILGIAFAILGLVSAWLLDRLVGMAFLIVGAFLLILPFSRLRDDE